MAGLTIPGHMQAGRSIQAGQANLGVKDGNGTPVGVGDENGNGNGTPVGAGEGNSESTRSRGIWRDYETRVQLQKARTQRQPGVRGFISKRETFHEQARPRTDGFSTPRRVYHTILMRTRAR